MNKVPVNYAFIDGQNFYKSVQELEEELKALEVELAWKLNSRNRIYKRN